MSNESGASFLPCSLGWRAMEEDNEGETYESTGKGGIGNHWGHFWNFQKF